MAAIYRETFGDAAVIVDAPLQMQRALAELRSRSGEAGPADFLPLLARASEPLDPASARIERIAYERGSLSVTLRARDAAQAARLRDALRPVPGRAPELRLEALDPAGTTLRITASAEGTAWRSAKP